VGVAGQVRPHRRECAEEAQRTPHGKRASCSGNQRNTFLKEQCLLGHTKFEGTKNGNYFN